MLKRKHNLKTLKNKENEINPRLNQGVDKEFVLVNYFGLV